MIPLVAHAFKGCVIEHCINKSASLKPGPVENSTGEVYLFERNPDELSGGHSESTQIGPSLVGTERAYASMRIARPHRARDPRYYIGIEPS